MQDALEGLPGILKIETKLERDLFIINYDSELVKPSTIDRAHHGALAARRFEPRA